MKYILSHWRGELSLKISVWINLITLTFLSVAFFIFILISTNTYVSPIVQLKIYFLGFAFIYFLLFPWQIVGTWRATNKYLQKGGKQSYAFLAKTLLIAYFLGLFYDIREDAQSLYEKYQFTQEKSHFGKVEVSLLSDKKTLSVSGPFNFGLNKEIYKMINDNPKISALLLNSPGGALYEAQQIKKLILNHKLDTYVSDQCHSACTVAFLAGEKRYIGLKAKLGFHQASDALHASHTYDPFGMRQAIAFREMERERTFFATRGVSKAFLEKIYQAAADDIWTPSHQELFESGVVHEYSKTHPLID